MYAFELQTKSIQNIKFHEMVIVKENQLISTFETFCRNRYRAYSLWHIGICAVMDSGRSTPIIIITFINVSMGMGPMQPAPNTHHNLNIHNTNK